MLKELISLETIIKQFLYISFAVKTQHYFKLYRRNQLRQRNLSNSIFKEILCN
jgi:hypothetical protein